MINNNLRELVQTLMDSYEEAYLLCYPKVEKIINYKMKDNDLIEHTLDEALDIYTEKGFYLFLKLLIYYRTVNPKNAKNYLEILKSSREEEYGEFIKKYKKVK